MLLSPTPLHRRLDSLREGGSRAGTIAGLTLLVLAVHAASAPLAQDATTSPEPSVDAERLRAWLESPGGPLPFGLVLTQDADGQLRGSVENGPESIPIPRVVRRTAETSSGADELLLDFPHYDATVRATRDADGIWAGEYEKRLGPERWRRLPFRARPVDGDDAALAAARFPGDAAPQTDLSGRWALRFSSSDDVAVGEFSQDGERVHGTILTTTGDYRYLAGALHGDRLRLSVFDGAHSFLFDARLDAEGRLSGDFWSGDTWHETFEGQRDEDVRLADPFSQTIWSSLASLSDVLLPDANGELQSLADPALRGQATLVVLFGSWCPNCHDEAPFLVELFERYGPRGLRIVGLAFEFTGDAERDSEQLRRFAARYGITYPLLLAGTADKADATLAFPGVDFVRSYPTTLFVDAGGRVQSIHSGFSGPATGDEHTRLRAEFEQRIEHLLDAHPLEQTELRRALPATAWRSDTPDGGRTVVFTETAEGGLRAHVSARGQAEPQPRTVQLVGQDAVWIGDELFRLDPVAQVLLSPTDFGARLMPSGAMDSPLLVEAGYTGVRKTEEALLHADPRLRREALWSLARRRRKAAGASAEDFLPLVADPEVEVALAAIWAVAATGDTSAAETVAALGVHPNARVRREVVRALQRFLPRLPALGAELERFAADPDPLVRALAAGR